MMAVQLVRHRFTVDDYQQMGAAGILRDDDRVELIDGEVIRMTPIGPRHGVRVARLDDWFHSLLRHLAVIWVQSSIRLGRHHEPQPDLVLLRPPLAPYETRLPGPEDVLLLVEVADTSLAYDSGVKLPLYAAAGIPEVWIVDVEGDAVEVHRTPTATGYADSRRVARGEHLTPQAFPDLRLPVDDLLG